MAPTIKGPWRQWHNKQKLANHNIFEGCDTVWWTQSDPSDPPDEPGGNINEVDSTWTYTKKNPTDPDLFVQYITYKNKRYGQFIFPAFFLEKDIYEISCRIVNKNNPPEEYVNSWSVKVS